MNHHSSKLARIRTSARKKLIISKKKIIKEGGCLWKAAFLHFLDFR
jgi:hypothetical protein